MDFDNNNPTTNDDDQQDAQSQPSVPTEGTDTGAPVDTTEQSVDSNENTGEAESSEGNTDQGSSEDSQPSEDEGSQPQY